MTIHSLRALGQSLLLSGLLVSSSIALSATPVTSEMLPEKLGAIISKITAGVSEEEKKIMADWSPAKQLSEFFCQELALTELGKTYEGADRVFLTVSDGQPPEFISENTIKGKGSVRYGADWADFSYECTVNMQTGAAESFTFE